MIGALKRQVKAAKNLTSGRINGSPLASVCGKVTVRRPDEELPVAKPIIVIEAEFVTAEGQTHTLEAKRVLKGERCHVELDGAVVEADIDVALAGKLEEAYVVYSVDMEEPDVDLELRARLKPAKFVVDTLLGGLFG